MGEIWSGSLIAMFVVGYNRCRRFARQLSNKYCDWKKVHSAAALSKLLKSVWLGREVHACFDLISITIVSFQKEGMKVCLITCIVPTGTMSIHVYTNARERERKLLTLHFYALPCILGWTFSVCSFQFFCPFVHHSHKENSVTCSMFIIFL